VKSAIHLRLGADASKLRSGTLAATAATCRSPRSGGAGHRRGRALRACNHINRSIRCSPHDTPSASMSCHPPGAVGPIAGNKVREPWHPALHCSGCANCAVVSDRHRTHPARHRAPRTTIPAGQIPWCFVMNPNFTLIPSRVGRSFF